MKLTSLVLIGALAAGGFTLVQAQQLLPLPEPPKPPDPPWARKGANIFDLPGRSAALVLG